MIKKYFRLAPFMVLGLALTTTACFKKDEEPKTEENQMAPANPGTPEEVPPAAPPAAPAPIEGSPEATPPTK